MTRLPGPGARDCDAGRATSDGRERGEPERDEPGEEPCGDRERHASKPHEAEAEPDAGQRRQRQSGERGLDEPAPVRVRSRAAVKAPIAMNAPWQSDGIPPRPSANASPVAASAR